MGNIITSLCLEDNESQDFLNVIIKEIYNIYEEEKNLIVLNNFELDEEGKNLNEELNEEELDHAELDHEEFDHKEFVKANLSKYFDKLKIISANNTSCYRYGKWVEKDECKAFNCYKKSAEMGNAIGKSNVGNCYQNGISVKKDEHKAFEYYLKLAEMNNACAVSSVEFCYHNWIGVEKNVYKAFETIKMQWT
ncbi:hypothetical protein C2G38_2175088 [Gigaspora rosea]|uniref:Uncharacterized protein n=1 Tax=Gigaspora rosea TaxID=44941 RepID=A0A397VPZ2_9GLOM|nr:hypothetical protein C2G38_2175088 [Gigaspora rosea]